MQTRAPRRRLLRVGVVCSMLAALASTPARAQDEAAPIDAKLEVDRGRVLASFDVTTAFTERFRRRLGGGLTSQALILVSLRSATGALVAETTRACQLRLDVWDDVVYARIRDSDRGRRRTFMLIDEALKECGEIRGLPVADTVLLRDGQAFRVHVAVALNPVSPDLLERTKEFLSNPRGSTSGRPQAFFGAVAQFFRSDSDALGEVFQFRSRPLPRPGEATR